MTTSPTTVFETRGSIQLTFSRAEYVLYLLRFLASSFRVLRLSTIAMGGEIQKSMYKTYQEGSEGMDILHGTVPGVHAFTIMLNAVGHATLNCKRFAGAMQELGIPYPFRLPFHHSPAASPALPEVSMHDCTHRRSFINDTIRSSITFRREQSLQ